MKRFGLFTAALALAGVASSAQASLVIDSFSTDPFILTQAALNSPVNKHQTGIGTANVIGGTRDTTLTVTLGNGTRTADVEVDTTDSTFNISNSVGVRSTTSLLYNANGSGLGGLNLTAFGNSVAFDVIEVDLNVSISVELVDTLGATSSLTIANVLTDSVARFSFQSLVGTADLTKINSIKLTFNMPTNADLTGSFLRVEGVPEPSTVASLVSGALAMGGLAVRRRRAARV